MLVTCPECGKKISNTANECPGCGFSGAGNYSKENAEYEASRFKIGHKWGNTTCEQCDKETEHLISGIEIIDRGSYSKDVGYFVTYKIKCTICNNEQGRG